MSSSIENTPAGEAAKAYRESLPSCSRPGCIMIRDSREPTPKDHFLAGFKMGQIKAREEELRAAPVCHTHDPNVSDKVAHYSRNLQFPLPPLVARLLQEGMISRKPISGCG